MMVVRACVGGDAGAGAGAGGIDFDQSMRLCDVVAYVLDIPLAAGSSVRVYFCSPLRSCFWK